MRRPKKPGTRLSRLLLLAIHGSLFTLLSCSFEITATRYALVYGAQNYDHPGINDLTYTGSDAVDMAASLEITGWMLAMQAPYSAGTVAKQEVFDDIDALVDSVDPDSSVVIYFSGHGVQFSDGSIYIIPTDAYYTSGTLDTNSLISPADLLQRMDALPCRNRILILDTCYSGGFVTDTGTLDTAPQNYGVYDDGTGGSALLAALGSYSELLSSAFQSYNPRTPIVVTAAGSEELSYESETYGNGVFTYFFLEAATMGDLDGNGFVTIQEAYRYARERIEKYWNFSNFVYYEASSGTYADYLPRISGNARDVVIF